MWEAPFASVSDRLREPGDKGRNERGQLPAAEFLKMAKRVWPVEAQVKTDAGG